MKVPNPFRYLWMLLLLLVASVPSLMAQTDATAIATQAQSAFTTIAPITIGIVAFYVILRLARRVLG